MGGSQSTRKLTVENEDPKSVIKVSEDVVQRLKGKQEVRSSVPSSPVMPNTRYATEVPQPLYFYEPSLTSLQIRQESISKLKENDEYWNKRVNSLEECHKNIHDIMEEEYNKTIEESNVPKPKKLPKNAVPPCQDSREALIQCYKANCKHPMNCAKLVEEFTQCAEKKRQEIISGGKKGNAL